MKTTLCSASSIAMLAVTLVPGAGRADEPKLKAKPAKAEPKVVKQGAAKPVQGPAAGRARIASRLKLKVDELVRGCQLIDEQQKKNDAHRAERHEAVLR